MEGQMNKRYYHKYNLGIPLIYFHNKAQCIKDEIFHPALLDDITWLAADTESIAHRFMKLNCKLIHSLGHVF